MTCPRDTLALILASLLTPQAYRVRFYDVRQTGITQRDAFQPNKAFPGFNVPSTVMHGRRNDPIWLIVARELMPFATCP